MKTYKEIIEAKMSGESPRRDKEFRDKHVIQKINHPVAGDDQFAAPKIKKDKTKHASHHDGDDMAVYEEVEQIDELSQDTLWNYHAKAGADLRKKREKLDKGTLTTKDYKQGQNRATGLNRAANKMHEEAEQIDEISQDKLYDYHAKAGADLRKKREKLDQGKLTMQDLKKGQNRVAGLNRAADKMHEEMSDAEMKKREDIVKGMKKNKADFQKRYGDRWKSVMYATATKAAMKESVDLDEDVTKMSHGRLKWHMNTGVPHGSYTKAEMKAERDRRLKTGEGEAYKKAKPGLNEETYLDETFKAGLMKLKDGSSVTVTSEQASTLNALFNELNSSNQKKMQERLMSTSNNFNEILSFAKAAL